MNSQMDTQGIKHDVTELIVETNSATKQLNQKQLDNILLFVSQIDDLFTCHIDMITELLTKMHANFDEAFKKHTRYEQSASSDLRKRFHYLDDDIMGKYIAKLNSQLQSVMKQIEMSHGQKMIRLVDGLIDKYTSHYPNYFKLNEMDDNKHFNSFFENRTQKSKLKKRTSKCNDFLMQRKRRRNKVRFNETRNNTIKFVPIRKVHNFQ